MNWWKRLCVWWEERKCESSSMAGHAYDVFLEPTKDEKAHVKRLGILPSCLDRACWRCGKTDLLLRRTIEYEDRKRSGKAVALKRLRAAHDADREPGTLAIVEAKGGEVSCAE